MPTTQDNAQLIVDIVSKVQAFYDTAFNHLLWTLGTMGAIIGVLVPFAISYLQKRKLRIDRDVLGRKIKRQIENAKRDLATELNELIEEGMNKLKNDFNKKLENEIKAIDRRFDVMACKWAFAYSNFMESQKHFDAAISFGIMTARLAAKSRQEIDLKRMLKNIQINFAKLTCEGVKNYKENDLEKGIEKLVKLLDKEFPEGSYKDESKAIDDALKAALQRK